jgi:esterase/lipase
MAAVDFDLKFTYVLAGWEGSTHDAHVLADAIERQDGYTVPELEPQCTSLIC